MSDPPFDTLWLGATIDEGEWHFHRRLLAHYGIVMQPGDFGDMLRQICGGSAILVHRAKRGRGVYRIRLKSTGAGIFVLASGGRVYTAYPPSRPIRRRAAAALAARRDMEAAIIPEPAEPTD